MPERLLLVPAGARLPSGVHAVRVVPATTKALVASAGSGTRRLGLLVPRAGADTAGTALDDGTDAAGAPALACLHFDDATVAAPVSLALDDGSNAAGGTLVASAGSGSQVRLVPRAGAGSNASGGMLVSLALGDATVAARGALASLDLGDATVDALVSLALDDGSNAAGGMLGSFAVGAAAGGSTGGRAGGAGGRRIFLGSDASTVFFGGISAAGGGRASRGRGARLVAAATAGSSGSEGDDDDASKAALMFYHLVEEQAITGVSVLGTIMKSNVGRQILADAEQKFKKVMALAKGRHEDRTMIAELAIRGAYSVVHLALAVYTNAADKLPEERSFVVTCLTFRLAEKIFGQEVAPILLTLNASDVLASGMTEKDKDLVRSVFLAITIAKRTAKILDDRYGIPGGADPPADA